MIQKYKMCFSKNDLTAWKKITQKKFLTSQRLNIDKIDKIKADFDFKAQKGLRGIP